MGVKAGLVWLRSWAEHHSFELHAGSLADERLVEFSAFFWRYLI